MENKTKHKARIGILDGFRTIAIISVLLFHLFSLDDFHYTYGQKYNFFWQGRYGVEFFFIISGFVIFYTLENTHSFKRFLINRWIRLFPSALIASTITLIVLLLLTNENLPNLLLKYLTNLSLVGSNLLNFLFSKNGQTFRYLDYSLWSLWPEIQFYFIAAIIFYFNRENFLRNFTITALIFIGIFWLNSNVIGSNYLNISPNGFCMHIVNKMIGVFNLFVYIQYFVIGMIFYKLFKLKKEGLRPNLYLISTLVFFVILQLYFAVTLSTRITNLCMIILFICFVYFPGLISFVDNKLFNKVGVSSYFLYLIHQAIALVLLNSFGKFIFPNTFIFPLFLIIIFISFSIIYTTNIEKLIIRKLKNQSRK
jgi:peptidoglycan/LPS O-acetylase OafA/YrhL